MGYQLSWLDDEETITLLRVMQPWDWPEFHESLQRSHEMVRSKEYVVHGIIVLGEDFRLPDASLLTQARSLYGNIPQNNGTTVVVGATHFIATVARILTRALGDRAHFAYANTVEEARALIDQRRAQEESPQE
ncbi:MAG: hypothetical protein JXB30_12420 [Anaerolineae bacterium]|nr:hypothetical protein [Anaerolineae bacterium]